MIVGEINGEFIKLDETSVRENSEIEGTIVLIISTLILIMGVITIVFEVFGN